MARDPKLYSESEKALDKAAGVNRLAVWSDLNLIERYAEKFAQDPDRVAANTSFDTIITFNSKWNKYEDFHKRKEDLREMMSKSKVE